MIPQEWVDSDCKPNQPGCCRFLCLSPRGWECAKPHRTVAAALNQRVLAGTMRATGDNCSGWPPHAAGSVADNANAGPARLGDLLNMVADIKDDFPGISEAAVQVEVRLRTLARKLGTADPG